MNIRVPYFKGSYRFTRTNVSGTTNHPLNLGAGVPEYKEPPHEEINFIGLNLGPHVIVKYVSPPFEIWHIPSHKYWMGLDLQTIKPSTWYLMRISGTMDRLNHGPYTLADFLYQISPEYQWHRAYKILVATVDELHEKCPFRVAFNNLGQEEVTYHPTVTEVKEFIANDDERACMIRSMELYRDGAWETY